MALATYNDLLASIAFWLNRQDLTNTIPDFITLAEARFNRELRVNDMISRDTAVFATDYVDMPTDWLETRSIRVVSDLEFNALDYLTPEAFYNLENDQLSGLTRYYTILGSRIFTLPAATGATLEMVYYAKIPALTSDPSPNWLYARSPDLYLFGALAASAPFLMEDERIPVWDAKVTQLLAAIQLEGDRAKRSSGKLMQTKRTFG